MSDHHHHNEDSHGGPLVRFERIEGGFVAVRLNDIALMSTHTINKAAEGEPLDLETHENETLIFVRAINANIVVKETFEEVWLKVRYL